MANSKLKEPLFNFLNVPIKTFTLRIIVEGGTCLAHHSFRVSSGHFVFCFHMNPAQPSGHHLEHLNLQNYVFKSLLTFSTTNHTAIYIASHIFAVMKIHYLSDSIDELNK